MGNTTIDYQKACNELLQRQMKGTVGVKTLDKIVYMCYTDYATQN